MRPNSVFKEANEVTMFLTPLLGIGKSEFLYPSYNKISNTRYINSYLLEEDIGILTYGYRDKLYDSFESMLILHPRFLSHKELFGGAYDLWVFELQEKEALECFLKGKYSGFPLKDKEVILLNSFLGKLQTKIVGRILSKDKAFRKLREQELRTSIPDSMELWSIYEHDRCVWNDKIYNILKQSLSDNRLLQNVQGKDFLG